MENHVEVEGSYWQNALVLFVLLIAYVILFEILQLNDLINPLILLLYLFSFFGFMILLAMKFEFRTPKSAKLYALTFGLFILNIALHAVMRY